MSDVSLERLKLQYKVSKTPGWSLSTLKNDTPNPMLFSWSRPQASFPHNSFQMTALFWLAFNHIPDYKGQWIGW